MPDDSADRRSDESHRTDSRGDAAIPEEVDRLAREFEAEGRPFARVTVVRREAPVSSNVGDRALVTPDGDLVGWVGGIGCAQSVAVKEARAALADGEPRLVGLAPDPDDVARPGLTAYPMTCHSGGTLELFVEPVTPTPRLVVVGESPAAETLVELADPLAFEVRHVGAGDDPAEAVSEGASVVVASMGEYDTAGVEAALRGGAGYVGLVASDRRRDDLAATVAERLGVDADAVTDAVTTPAGLDIGAKTGEEIAVGILAELVAVRRNVDGPIDLTVGDPSRVVVGEAPERHGDRDETVVDPVCGMDVVVGEAAATVEHGGETYRFCGQGCADAFADDPGSYLDDADVEVTAGD